MIAAVIIVAAGSSTRMGMGRKKEYLALSGKPVIQHTCEAFLSSERFHYMCIVAPPSGIGTARRILGPFLQRATAMYSVNAAGGTGDSAGHSAADDAGPVQLAVSFTEGGATRQQSVLNGLRALEPAAPDYILIHDGARPWISTDCICTVLDQTAVHGACAPVIVPPDAIKRIDADGFISDHFSRKDTLGIQTPQGFRFRDILQAHEAAAVDGWKYIDDTEIYSRYVEPVFTVAGEAANRKITYAHDFSTGTLQPNSI